MVATKEVKESEADECVLSYPVNRVIGAISARKDDAYHAAVDPEAWASAKRGSMVTSPAGVCIDYDDLTINAVAAGPAPAPRLGPVRMESEAKEAMV